MWRRQHGVSTAKPQPNNDVTENLVIGLIYFLALPFLKYPMHGVSGRREPTEPTVCGRKVAFDIRVYYINNLRPFNGSVYD